MHDLGASVAGPGATAAPGRPNAPERRRSRLARWFDSWMRSLGMALVLFLVIKTFFFEAFQIASGSMTRTLLTGDFLFVNKALYGAQIPGTKARLPGFRQPRRGDVIVFAFPRDPSQDYVKRVIGTPGDTVAMRHGQVVLNGRRQIEPYVQRVDSLNDVSSADFDWQRPFVAAASNEDRRRYHPTRDTWGPLVVPAGKYLVLGDNRDDSSDSRYWGFVDASAVKGRTLLVYFSYDRETRDALPWLMDIRWSRLGSLIH
ncbi:MAG TPA: signal peptidase I [Gemmatimonadales bacterium]|jgi:signal peptidase I